MADTVTRCEDPDCHPCRRCAEQATSVRDVLAQALAAMRDLVDTIMVWHGVDDAWPIYRDHSPELRRWREFVAKHGSG